MKRIGQRFRNTGDPPGRPGIRRHPDDPAMTATDTRHGGRRAQRRRPRASAFPSSTPCEPMRSAERVRRHLPVVLRMSVESPLRPYLKPSSLSRCSFLISAFCSTGPSRMPGTHGSRCAGDRSVRGAPGAAHPPGLFGGTSLRRCPIDKSRRGRNRARRVHLGRSVLLLRIPPEIYDSDTLLGGISAAWTLCVELALSRCCRSGRC